jgi:segregation and condensation protein A
MEKGEKGLGNDQIFEIMTNQEVSWQSIIYDLVNTEQLDPWNIDLAKLANKYLEKIKELEETNFFVSSKVLLAASILLRLKSEILLYKYIKSVDEILFGRKDENKKVAERIIIDANELPLLYPKTPLPRYRKVSLQELMNALDQAMSTETRRIKKETSRLIQEKSADIVLPKTKISVKDRIRVIYAKMLTHFKKKNAKMSYTDLAGMDKEERIACFLPCLHLENQQKVFLEQEKHFAEIYLWLYGHYKKSNPTLNQELKELPTETGFENPLADFFNLK